MLVCWIVALQSQAFFQNTMADGRSRSVSLSQVCSSTKNGIGVDVLELMAFGVPSYACACLFDLGGQDELRSLFDVDVAFADVNDLFGEPDDPSWCLVSSPVNDSGNADAASSGLGEVCCEVCSFSRWH